MTNQNQHCRTLQSKASCRPVLQNRTMDCSLQLSIPSPACLDHFCGRWLVCPWSGLFSACRCTFVQSWVAAWHPRCSSTFFTSGFLSFGFPLCLLEKRSSTVLIAKISGRLF